MVQPFIYDITYSVNLSLNILLDCNSIRLNNYLVLQMHSGFKWLNCFDKENHTIVKMP